MTASLVWLDGRLQPLEQARISPLDRGFLFGDGVYEVLPVHGGRAYRFDAHLDRLNRSLREIRMAPVHDREGWLRISGALVHGNGGGDLLLYWQVTRGVEAVRYHVPKPETRPTVFACVSPLPPPPAGFPDRGATAVTTADTRWSRCDIKATSLLANVLLRWQAADAGASEAILLRDGRLTEGSTSSAHLVQDSRLLSPPQSSAILPGTTRSVVHELAMRRGIACEQRLVTEQELRSADEILLASAGGGIRPVTTLDDRLVGDGKPGPVFRSLYAGYLETLEEFSTDLPA